LAVPRPVDALAVGQINAICVLPQIAIKVRKGQRDGPDQHAPAHLVGCFHVEPAAGVPDKVPDAAKGVIPQAQDRERHDQIAEEGGDDAVHGGEIGRTGRRRDQPPDQQKRRDDHRVAGDPDKDRRD
jgi:hypothetical protein